MRDLPSAIDEIARHHSFLVLCHEEPDGDALGSSLALATGLRILGKEVAVVCRDEVPEPFRFLPGYDAIKQDFPDGETDALIIVDCGDLSRTGFADRVRDFRTRRKVILNIDHHLQNGLHKIATHNLVNPLVAASAQIVWEILGALGIEITPEMATQLLTALFTDTGGFRHTNTSKGVLELAAHLLLKGARLKKVVRSIAPTKSLFALRLWGIVLSRIRRHPHLPIVSSYVTQEDLTAVRASLEDLAGVANMINSIPQAEVAVLFTELSKGEVKVSLRTESERIDVSRLGSLFGGGGHKKAAGFRVKGELKRIGRKWLILPAEHAVFESQARTSIAEAGS